MVVDKATLGNNEEFGWHFVVMKVKVHEGLKVDDSGNSPGFSD